MTCLIVRFCSASTRDLHCPMLFTHVQPTRKHACAMYACLMFAIMLLYCSLCACGRGLLQKRCASSVLCPFAWRPLLRRGSPLARVLVLQRHHTRLQRDADLIADLDVLDIDHRGDADLLSRYLDCDGIIRHVREIGLHATHTPIRDHEVWVGGAATRPIRLIVPRTYVRRSVVSNIRGRQHHAEVSRILWHRLGGEADLGAQGTSTSLPASYSCMANTTRLGFNWIFTLTFDL